MNPRQNIIRCALYGTGVQFYLSSHIIFYFLLFACLIDLI